VIFRNYYLVLQKGGGYAEEKNCVVCQGSIRERRESEFDATFGPMIIGPGSRKQFH
jgi:hypothetical protein